MGKGNQDEYKGTVSNTPPEGCQHYAELSDVPWDIQKYVSLDSCIRLPLIWTRYYHQRYSIFSKYDYGIWMTEDAWFGVTPEPVAE